MRREMKEDKGMYRSWVRFRTGGNYCIAEKKLQTRACGMQAGWRRAGEKGRESEE